MFCDHVLNVIHATVANLNCVLVENFVQFVAKCLSTRLKKLRARFVLMFLLDGELNQMILRVYSCAGLMFCLCVKLLCPSAV